MSEFKKMKFWIGDDPELSESVQKILFDIGYAWFAGNGSAEYTESCALYAYDNGRLQRATSADPRYFDRHDNEEINIDWMRTTKPETIELNGKNWLKSDIDKAMEAAKELGQLKPVD